MGDSSETHRLVCPHFHIVLRCFGLFNMFRVLRHGSLWFWSEGLAILGFGEETIGVSFLSPCFSTYTNVNMGMLFK